jgi:hypothetical protein
MSRTTSSNHGGPIGLDKSDAWRKATVSQRSNAIGSPSVTSNAMNAKLNRRTATNKVGAQDLRCLTAFCHSFALIFVALTLQSEYPTTTQQEGNTSLRPSPLIVHPSAKPVSRPRFGKSATVSAPALARTYIGKLEAESVIQRQGDGFLVEQSRVAYLRYLRRERRQSPRSEADAEHVKVKTECCNSG